jgi:hypothetical protein
MCVPPPATSAQGIWQGTTNTNQTVEGVVLADGSSYFIYSQPGSSTSIVGALLGNATFDHGTLSATNAVDYNIGGAAYSATVSGTYVQGSTINGTVIAAGTSGTVSLSYNSIYEQPANLAAAAGTYTATVGSLGGVQTATLTLAANGAIAGNGGGCTFSGAATPHGSVNVFDVQVTFNGGACSFGTSTVNGVAFYDAPNRTLYGGAPNASRTDVLLFIGTK